jgi:predicted dehydrogenase
MKEVKIAMVGTGFAANIHAEAYRALPGINAHVVAVASKELDQAKVFCKEYGYPDNIYEDAANMIKEVDADIIDLVVPTFLHVPFAILAAHAGKYVIFE